MLHLGPEQRKQLKIASRVGALGIEFAIALMIGYAGGSWLDTQLGTEPYLARSGAILGILASFKSLFDLGRRLQALDP